MPKAMRLKRTAIPVLLLAACGGGEAGADRDSDAIDPVTASADSPGSRPPAGSDRVLPVDTGAWVVEVPAGASPSPAGWTSGASTGGSAGGIAVLQALRSARHAEYDRVVFEFDTHVPTYRLEYVDTPQHECGSGEPVRVAGDGWLQVSLEPANAHTEAGRPTAPRRITDPAGANLREIRRICDFEAHVDWIIGVGSPNPYRAIVLDGPPRLVVDIRR